jgi:hypothetical protein
MRVKMPFLISFVFSALLVHTIRSRYLKERERKTDLETFGMHFCRAVNLKRGCYYVKNYYKII